MEAYLDIETTGLSQLTSSITVIGIYRQTPQGFELIQLVGNAISRESVLQALEGIEILYTYNGARFDLTFIEAKLQIALESLMEHRDLMYDCWRQKLYGGLKVVERCLNIGRVTTGITGLDAVNLWWRYAREEDEAALRTLLAYNREDVVNLKELKEKLGVS
ncbi:MAG: ribonuclease H-like domain-containing protein [Dehalococcoidia bacterium]|nr:ribonuclease H-like domain-containing protein [Dehalococcoidia bacterium]